MGEWWDGLYGNGVRRSCDWFVWVRTECWTWGSGELPEWLTKRLLASRGGFGTTELITRIPPLNREDIVFLTVTNSCFFFGGGGGGYKVTVPNTIRRSLITCKRSWRIKRERMNAFWKPSVHCIECFHFFFSLWRPQSYSGLGRLIVEVSRSHTDTPHSVGLLWTSDRPVADTCIWQQTTFTRDIHAPRRDLNPQSQQTSTADLRLRSRGHRDRQAVCY
jgi:hypothetical protein